MNVISTRDAKKSMDALLAVLQGISEEGGLFVPSFFPKLDLNEFSGAARAGYPTLAAKTLALFFDLPESELLELTQEAYASFDTQEVAPLTRLSHAHVLELWHGPTLAFKDMALQVLPYFLTTAAKKKALNKKIVILVATSGDTGKAALDGFKDVPGTEILVFYPEEGVSPMQKRQMRTQEGENVGVCAIQGNFDDCQNGVKAIFTDPQVKQQLDQAGMMFSSANSINWGRLLPQIVYYISAYATLAADGEIAFGDPINVVVPTGNFGNILAAYYAKKMGLPVKKLICASNINKVLTDFINTGVYNRNREFYATCSPSMDILISSNLERLLYLLTGEDDAQIREWFGALAKDGTYTVTDAVKQALQADFCAGYCDDADTKRTIHEIYEKYSYTCDTHTAVAVKVYREYKEKTGDTTKTLIASTASPYKFSASVLEALEGAPSSLDEYAMIDALAERSKLEIPAALAQLKNKPERFTDSIARTDMREYVLRQLGL